MQITAVICSYNRQEYLKQSITSLVNQSLDKALYEILVVDNASTDNTKHVISNFFSHIPNIRYIYEPNLGLSFARNCAWKNSRGKYICYLDDDAIAAANWLESFWKIFTTYQPTPAVVGGKIIPFWEAPKPLWLSDSLASKKLSLLDWGDKPLEIKRNQWLCGGNTGYHKELLGNCHAFSTEIGRKGNSLLADEDFLLHKQLQKKGYVVLYHPLICMEHCIHKNRLRKKYFFQAAYTGGISRWLSLVKLYGITKRQRFLYSVMKVCLCALLSPCFLFFIVPDFHPKIMEIKCKILYTYGFFHL